MIRLEMKNCNMTFIREVTNISALSSGKIDKFEYVKGEEILPTDQTRVIEQAKLTYSPFSNLQKKKKKKIEDHIKYLLESNQLIKMLILTEIAHHIKHKKRQLMNLLKKDLLNFRIQG